MDIEVSRLIAAPPERVAAIMFDPRWDPEWIGGARAVGKVAADPTAIGARTLRIGGFLGRRFSWVTEVREHLPGALLAMDFVEGPMKGSVTYRIEPAAGGSRVSIRNKGSASFSMPGMAWMLRRSVARDLEHLAELVERD